ncbi:MAG TPA: hypothetical protein VF221_10515 [Chloroflexota bacterium]
MDVGEFIDSYSDDLIYLREARAALLTHPLSPEWAFADHWDACAGRVASVFMIGSIEAMLETWREKDSRGILDNYFSDKVTNGARISALQQAFTEAGIDVDPAVFEDYLAVKYLRNTIIHGRWKEHEKEWLEGRGFPTDVRSLKREHLDRIEFVNQNMMFYIFLSGQPGVAGVAPEKPPNFIRLKELGSYDSYGAGILRPHDLDRIIWNNLERIDARISADIERTVLTARYDWTEGRSTNELEKLDPDERKSLFYLSARRAGEEDCEALAQHRPLASDALVFWREYWQRTSATHDVSDQSINRALGILGVLQERHLEARLWPVIEQMPTVEALRLIETKVAMDGQHSHEEILAAVHTGHAAYDAVPNIMPITLLTLRLPIVDPARTHDYLAEASRALTAFTLNRTWYSWVEEQRAPTLDGLDFYKRMSDLFAQRSSNSA